uniref:Uncharacterized protein n=1 Tax=Setaria viridis TaxID=4556 RepID=A0A4V6DDU1_SETVI|nr:hypothetical protein SEVIR_1G343550v2 [Setaria viridis]
MNEAVSRNKQLESNSPFNPKCSFVCCILFENKGWMSKPCSVFFAACSWKSPDYSRSGFVLKLVPKIK